MGNTLFEGEMILHPKTKANATSRGWFIVIATMCCSGLLSSCTNLIGSSSNGSGESLNASQALTTSSSHLITINRVIQSKTDPHNVLDIISDGIGNYCTSTDGSGSSGAGESTCTCEFSCTSKNGSQEIWEVETSYYETSLIRCEYDFSNCGSENVDVRVHILPSDAHSNEKEFATDSASSGLDLSDENSFAQIKRIQCRDYLSIPYMFDSNMYDPFRSESTYHSYPLNFYTDSIGKTLANFSEKSSIQTNLSYWDCAYNPYDPPEWENLRIYSVGSGGEEGNKLIYNTADNTSSRSNFYLAKEKTGIFKEAIHAYSIPESRSTEEGDDGFTGGNYGPIGYGANLLADGSCPEEYVEIPDGFKWAKLWAFRASYEPRSYVQFSSEIADTVGVACNPGNYNENANPGSESQGTPVFRDCSPFEDDGGGDDDWIYDNYNPLDSFYQDSYTIGSSNNCYDFTWHDGDEDECRIKDSDCFNGTSWAYDPIPDGTYSINALKDQLETTLNEACEFARNEGTYANCDCEDIDVSFDSDPESNLFGRWSFTFNDASEPPAPKWRPNVSTNNAYDFVVFSLGFENGGDNWWDANDDEGETWDDDNDVEIITSINTVTPNEYSTEAGELAARVLLGSQACFAYATPDTIGPFQAPLNSTAGQLDLFEDEYGEDIGVDETHITRNAIDIWERIGGLNEDISTDDLSLNLEETAKNYSNVDSDFEPWDKVRDTYPDTNLGDRAIPYDQSDNFFFGELEAVARYDYLFVVTPTSVTVETMKNKDAGYEPYYPYTYKSSTYCGADDPDGNADCIANASSDKKTSFDIWTNQIGENPSDEESDIVYPVCVIQPE